MPTSTNGTRTVLSAGVMSRRVTMSSKPATATSSGTRTPASRAAAIAPTAMTSLTAKTISAGGPSRSSVCIPSYPPSRVKPVVITASGSTGWPSSASASQKPAHRSRAVKWSVGPASTAKRRYPSSCRARASAAAPLRFSMTTVSTPTSGWPISATAPPARRKSSSARLMSLSASLSSRRPPAITIARARCRVRTSTNRGSLEGSCWVLARVTARSAREAVASDTPASRATCGNVTGPATAQGKGLPPVAEWMSAPGRSRGRESDDQLWLESDLLVLDGTPGLARRDLLEEQLSAAAPELGAWLADRGQRHRGRRRELDVVVADDRYVVRDAQPVRREPLEQADGDQIVRCEDRGRTVVGRQDHQVLGRLAPRGSGQATGGDGEKDRTRGGLHNGLGTLTPVAHLSQARWTAHEREPPVPLREQMRRRDSAAVDVVHRDRRVRGVVRVVVQEDDRDTQPREGSQRRSDIADRCDEHAPDTLFLEELEVAPFACLLSSAIAQEDHTAEILNGVLHAARDVGEEGVGSVDHD